MRAHKRLQLESGRVWSSTVGTTKRQKPPGGTRGQDEDHPVALEADRRCPSLARVRRPILADLTRAICGRSIGADQSGRAVRLSVGNRSQLERPGRRMPVVPAEVYVTAGLEPPPSRHQRNDRSCSQVVEFASFHAPKKGLPFLGGIPEHMPTRLLRVAHKDHTIVRRDLDAFVGCAEASSAP